MNKTPARKHSFVVHVVHGDLGFGREVHCSASKLARIQAHEFARIERAGKGFLRIEMPGKFTTWAEIHYEYSARAKHAGMSSWMTSTRGEPARYL